LPEIDFLITSPPYGQMLNKEVGEVYKLRKKEGLDTKYSDNKDDLGNIEDYNLFIKKLVNIFVKIKPYLKEKAYLVVILQNYSNYGRWVPLAWDIGKALDEHFTLKGERIWCQDHKTLMPYGYRWGWVTNMHHHYCLIFRKEK